MRPELMHPSDEAIAEVAEALGTLDEVGVSEKSVKAFNQAFGTGLPLEFFEGWWRSQSAEEAAEVVLAQKVPVVADITREELVQAVQHVLDGEHTDWYLAVVDRNTPHPAVSDLIFWPEDGDPTAEQVVDRALRG